MTAAVIQHRSWVEDLNSYRDTRGSRSYSTLEHAPKRYPRTNLVPFGASKHPLYPYDEHRDGIPTGKIHIDIEVQQDRNKRHGWGNVSLLKEQEGCVDLSLQGSQHLRTGKGQPAPPLGKDGRNNLFGVLQQTEVGGPDSWIGNQLIEPSTGKRHADAPKDPKGRRDLFDVLHARNPGVPADDSWLGHQLIDPAKGKARPLGPEEVRGRKDLQDVIGQSILRDPNRAQLLARGADPLGDAWCGHMLISPSTGKLPLPNVAAAQEVLQGGTFKYGDRTSPDGSRMQMRRVKPPQPDRARDVINGLSTGDDWGKFSKRQLHEPRGNNPTNRTDMYAHMTYRPLTQLEQTTYAHAYDDGGPTGRRYVDPKPGSKGPGKGIDMLQWKPKQRFSSFVPYGGLMQEGRHTKHGKIRATTA